MTNHKATGTANVNNGTATTNQLTINETLTPGSYTIKAKLIENDTYDETTATGTLNILKHDTHIEVANANGYTDDTVDLTATVTDENNNNVTEGTIAWDVYEETFLDITDISNWEYGKYQNTSLTQEQLRNPTITQEGYMSGGRGQIVYYNQAISGALSEYTIRATVKNTQAFNRIGICTISENNNTLNDNNMFWLLTNLVPVADTNTTYELEFKFLNGICYVYCDGTYTGVNKNYNGINDMLYFATFSNTLDAQPVIVKSLSTVDSVDLNTIPTGGGAMTKYSILCDEDFDKGFNTNNWTGNGTRTINNDGTLSLTYGSGITNNYDVSLPSSDWILHMDMDIDTTAQSTVTYGNNVDGAVYIALYSDKTTKIRETTVSGGTHTVSKTVDVDKFITNGNTRNTLTIQRSGNKLTFKYISNDTGNIVEYTREYTELRSNGFLQIQTWNGAEYTIQSLTVLEKIGGGGQLV